MLVLYTCSAVLGAVQHKLIFCCSVAWALAGVGHGCNCQVGGPVPAPSPSAAQPTAKTRSFCAPPSGQGSPPPSPEGRSGRPSPSHAAPDGPSCVWGSRWAPVATCWGRAPGGRQLQQRARTPGARRWEKSPSPATQLAQPGRVGWGFGRGRGLLPFKAPRVAGESRHSNCQGRLGEGTLVPGAAARPTELAKWSCLQCTCARPPLIPACAPLQGAATAAPAAAATAEPAGGDPRWLGPPVAQEAGRRIFQSFEDEGLTYELGEWAVGCGPGGPRMAGGALQGCPAGGSCWPPVSGGRPSPERPPSRRRPVVLPRAVPAAQPPATR